LFHVEQFTIFIELEIVFRGNAWGNDGC